MRWLVLVRLDNMDGMLFDWRSPSSYLAEHPGVATTDCGIVAVPVSSPEPLLKAAARAGFGTLSKTNLAAIMAELGHSADTSKSTFDVCFQLVKEVLEADDKSALEVMGKRIAQMDAHNTPCVDELLALDEGNCGIDKAEIQEMQEKSATPCRPSGRRSSSRASTGRSTVWSILADLTRSRSEAQTLATEAARAAADRRLPCRSAT